jgi:hypothetical protein
MISNRMAGLILALYLAGSPSTANAQTWGYVPPTTTYYVDPGTGATMSYQAPAQGVRVYGPGMYSSYSPFYYSPRAAYSYGPSYYSFATPNYSYPYTGYTTYYRSWRWVR